MILDGKPVARKIFENLKSRPVPGGALCVVFVGDDRVSSLYVAKKREAAQALKVKFILRNLPPQTSEKQLKLEIEKLNSDPEIRGILVQIPLPKEIDREKIARLIASEKDVDGFNYIANGSGVVVPPTVLAIDEILNFYKINKAGKKILIVGRGFLVGRPLENFWRNQGFSVESVDRSSDDYSMKVSNSDIVVVATGGAKKFSKADFNAGTTVIDASTVAEENEVSGDVDLSDWPEEISLAPTPGGVGPVTVAELFHNFYSL